MGRDRNESGLLETSSEKTTREQTEDKRAEKRHRNLQLFFNGVLMVSTVLTAAIVWFQSGILKNTLEETRKQAKSSEDAVKVARDTLNASIASSKAGDEQAKTSRESSEALSKSAMVASAKQTADTLAASVAQMRMDQRAWLGITSTELTPIFTEHLPEGTKVRINMGIMNTGKTPALAVGTVFDCIGVTTEKLKRFAYPMTIDGPWIDAVLAQKEKHRIPRGTEVIQPGHTDYAYVLTGPTDKEAPDDILGGGKVLYVFGNVKYRDIFGTPHLTKFCSYITVEDRVATGFAPCKFHNDAN